MCNAHPNFQPTPCRDHTVSFHTLRNFDLTCKPPVGFSGSMTVVTFAECGTDLPVPEAFDRCSQSSADVTVDSLEVPAEASESEGLYDGALPGNLVGADDEDLNSFAERTDLEAKDDALVQETLVDGKTKDPCNTHSPPLTFQESRVFRFYGESGHAQCFDRRWLTLPWELESWRQSSEMSLWSHCPSLSN